jgi:hypothetical protein
MITILNHKNPSNSSYAYQVLEDPIKNTRFQIAFPVTFNDLLTNPNYLNSFNEYIINLSNV